MEGWFWRVSDESSGRALIALCSVNRHPDGDWSTTAVAVHPGLTVRSAACCRTGRHTRSASPPATKPATSRSAPTGSTSNSMTWSRYGISRSGSAKRPEAFGGGGVFSAIPFLNQFWHPYYLGGRASGTVSYGAESWSFDDAKLYAERNWDRVSAALVVGAAHDFGDADVSMAFSGQAAVPGTVARDVKQGGGAGRRG